MPLMLDVVRFVILLCSLVLSLFKITRVLCLRVNRLEVTCIVLLNMPIILGLYMKQLSLMWLFRLLKMFWGLTILIR